MQFFTRRHADKDQQQHASRVSRTLFVQIPAQLHRTGRGQVDMPEGRLRVTPFPAFRMARFVVFMSDGSTLFAITLRLQALAI